MKSHRTEIALGLLLAVLFACFWAWQAPGARGRLAATEVEEYIGKMKGRLPATPEREAEFLARLPAWGNADDGKPVYMLNVMSYLPQLQPVPGESSTDISPVESNRIYEAHVMPLAVQLGAYPIVGGETSGIPMPGMRHNDLTGADQAIDRTDRVLVMRYPSRRAFLELISDPRYLRWAPYKFAALELALLPVTARAVIPDLRWIVGWVGLTALLATGWFLAARRAASGKGRELRPNRSLIRASRGENGAATCRANTRQPKYRRGPAPSRAPGSAASP